MSPAKGMKRADREAGRDDVMAREKERERLSLEAVHRCFCPAPLPSRRYAGTWLCRLCGRLIERRA